MTDCICNQSVSISWILNILLNSPNFVDMGDDMVAGNIEINNKSLFLSDVIIPATTVCRRCTFKPFIFIVAIMSQILNNV